MKWTELKLPSTKELTAREIGKFQKIIPSIDANELSFDELRIAFKYCLNVLESAAIRQIFAEKEQTRNEAIEKATSECVENATKNVDSNESFYVKTIQELNREIAQNIYNRALVDDNDDDGGSSSGGGTIEGSDKLQWNAVGKKDLVRRIHMKNDHIKRLMCEYDVLHDENKRMKQELLTLNVTVKQLNRQLNESNAELNEQNELNRQSNEAIVILQKEVNAVRSRMSRIEGDKRKYKKEILALGHEIEAKMKIWNKLLEERHEKVATETRDSFADEIEPRESSQSRRLEVDALSRAVAKRNMIIVEMEILLTELTREIAESAGVINRIVNDLAQRESKFVGHLEKLQKQLTRIANHSIEKTSNSNETVKNPSPKSGKKKRSNEKIFSKILKKPGAKGAQFA